jgi:putative oxidoreductase
MTRSTKLSSLYLRLALATAYLWEVADRTGILGAPGRPHVGWGDWSHFVAYARTVLSFLPAAWIPLFAFLASVCEGAIGLLLLFGLSTRMAAIGSGVLSLCFALSMAISFGIDSPLGYSVFTVSAASFLLASMSDNSFHVKKILS